MRHLLWLASEGVLWTVIVALVVVVYFGCVPPDS